MKDIITACKVKIQTWITDLNLALRPIFYETQTKLKNKYEILSLRERIFIGLFGLAFVFFLWNLTVNHFFESKKEQYAKDKQALVSTIKELQVKASTLQKNAGDASYTAIVKESEQLKLHNQMLDSEISKQVKQLVSTKEMHTMLQEIINKIVGVEVVSIESLPPKEILLGNKNESLEIGGKPFKVFNHSLKIEFVSTYLGTLMLVESLEKQKFKIFWDEINFNVEKYPKATISITIHTLGLEEGWFDA